MEDGCKQRTKGEGKKKKKTVNVIKDTGHSTM
jgi:hypothetical protein